MVKYTAMAQHVEKAALAKLSQGKRLGIASQSSLTPSSLPAPPPHSLDVSNVRLRIVEIG